jgi:hypothetical protein
VPRNEIRTRLQVAQAEPCRHDVSLTNSIRFRRGRPGTPPRSSGP